MQKQTKQCQNCENEFTIEPEDFEFYEKMKVPAPTWCAECQLRRRMTFRNERNLYKRQDAATGKEIVSMYSPDKPFAVYNQKYWWSDNWDPLASGQDHDFSKPFFEQFKGLMRKVAWPALVNVNAVNSEYCNITVNNKNCYLVFGGDFNEDCSYSAFSMYSKDTMDVYWMNKGELCYQNIDSENCYKVFFSINTRDSSNSAFLLNCVNCQHCLGCVNLRNKSYNIFNKQYSKEEYQQKVKEFNLGGFPGLNSFKEKFEKFKFTLPCRYAEIVKSVDSTGHNVHNAKNCANCFDVYENAEDCKNLLIAGWGLKDTFNSDHIGHNSELVYDSVAFSSSSRSVFSFLGISIFDAQYSINCHSSSHLFACVGLRKKEYCILNKQYTKEEYEDLVPKIIKHMNKMPYTDKKGRVYKYGEFFPPELSPFAYNETIAQEYFPLTKQEALAQGYTWYDRPAPEHKPTIVAADLPDNIKDVDDSILNEVIECQRADLGQSSRGLPSGQCTTAFKIIPQELEFYRKMNLPLPRLCPNCRHYQRIKQRNPLKLWKRQCQCGGAKSTNDVYANTAKHAHNDTPCPNEFQTTYAPERTEIVYCEKCYLDEVV